MKAIVLSALLAISSVSAQTLPVNTLWSYAFASNAYTTGGVTTTDNSPFQCVLGLNLGTQADMTNTDSTCYTQTALTKSLLDQIANSMYITVTQFSFASLNTNFNSIIQNLNSLFVQVNIQSIACQNSLQIKQFATRTQTLSGFFNSIFTVGYGVGMQFIFPSGTPSPIYTAGLNIYTTFYNWIGSGTQPNPHTLCKQFGIIISQYLQCFTDSIVVISTS